MDERRRELKKVWKANQRAEAEARLPYPRTVLIGLFEFLEQGFQLRECDHSFRITTQWAEQNRLPATKIIEWTRQHGGNCDCEVLANVPSSNAAIGE